MAVKAKRHKLGGGKDVVAARKKRFANELVKNGGNRAKAAVTVGYSARSARTLGSRLSSQVDTKAAVQSALARALEISDLSRDRVLLEIGRLATFDPGKLYRADGSMIPVHLLDEDTRRAIASTEHDEITISGGKNKPKQVIGTNKKIRFWDKNAALDKLAKHYNVYEADNMSNKPELSIQVLVVSPEDLKKIS